MARKAKQANGSSGTHPQTEGTPGSELVPESEFKSPDGFKDVFSGVTGWWAQVPGNTIQGIMQEYFKTDSKFISARNPDGKKRVYKIQITNAASGPKGCLVLSAAEGAEPGVPIRAKVGDIVGVDEKGFLQSLEKVLAGQEVWIAYQGKEPPSQDYPQGRHVYIGPKAKPARVNPVTGEVTS